MMRSWENRPDTVVMDEPLYAASLAVTGGDHPMRDDILAAGPADPAAAVAACVAPLPDGATVSYQKHMAHHLMSTFDREWLDQLTHILLIRDPRRVIASYTKVWSEVTVASIGLPQQLELADRAALVIDSADFLGSPRRHLEVMCRTLGVPVDDALLDSMTRWPSGRRASDGVWAPAWYEAVEASTGFGPPPGSAPVDLPPAFEAVAAEADAMYRKLRARRVVVDD